MATYSPGNFVTRNDYNWVTSMDLDKPDIDPEVRPIFGDQMLTGMLSMIGSEKGTSALQYYHTEEDRIYPKLKVTNGAGAGAGQAVTFTLDADATLSVSNSSPYDTSATAKDVVVPRAGEVLMIKPASGVANVGTSIYAVVTSVNATAGTFVAQPLDSNDTIPAQASATEVIITGNINPEGSVAVSGRQPRVTRKQNNLQTFRGGTEITGTAKNIVTWEKFTDQNGRSVHVNYLHG